MKGVLVFAVLLAVSASATASGCPKELSTTLLPDFKDCAGFWQCADGVPLFQTCPEGLHFSARLQRCTLPVFARCQAITDEAPVHSGFMSGILDRLRNVISRKAEPVPLVEEPPELPTDDLPNEEDTIRRFPDAEVRVTDGDTEEAEKSAEVGSENEAQKSADERVKNESDKKEEEKQQKPEEDGMEEEHDESERSEEKIEEEGDGEKEEDEEKTDETSGVENVAVGNDGEDRQGSKKDATVVKKKKDEEEEDEKKKKSKDVKRREKGSKKNKSEEKGKDSESDAESDEE